MSKIIFEFDSNVDQENIKIHYEAFKFYSVICDLQNEFRDKIKYSKHNKTDLYWRDRLQALLDERDVKI